MRKPTIQQRREADIAKLKELQQQTDPELAHSQADDLLCLLLRDLGFGDVVDEFEKLTRWCG